MSYEWNLSAKGNLYTKINDNYSYLQSQDFLIYATITV